jgi:putative transposase
VLRVGRPLRIEVPDGYYHVHARGNDRQGIFFGNWSGRLFVRELERATRRHRWRILGYCLMGNHYHAVLQIREGLSAGMCELNGRFARTSNAVNKRADHLFGKRFASHLIEREDYLFESLRYTLLNPGRAHQVEHPSNWRWSSFAATLGHGPAPRFLDVDWILSHFGATRQRGAKEFLRYVEAGIGLPRPVPGTEGRRL